MKNNTLNNDKSRVIKVAVLEDSPNDYKSLRETLHNVPDIEIVYHSYDAVVFIDAVIENPDIDIALIDILLGADQINGIEVIRQLKSATTEERDLPCLAFTKLYDLSYLIDAVDAGATGFLRKEIPTRVDPNTGGREPDKTYVIDYAQGIRTVAGGQTCFDKILIMELVKAYQGQSPSSPLNQPHINAIQFTRRQLEIMSIRVKYPDFTNPQIAYVLKVVEQTVRGHTSNINRLLGVHSYRDAIEKWKTNNLKTLPLRPDYESRCQEILTRR